MGQQVFEDAPVEAQDDLGRFDVPHRPLNVSDMCRAFGISRATFYRRDKLGIYHDFLLVPVYGKKQWNGEKVARWRRGESLRRPIFGRKAR